MLYVCKKLYLALIISIVFLGLLFSVASASAANYSVGCGPNPPFTPCNSVITIDMTGVKTIDLTAASFDDKGSITITSPIGIMTTYNSSIGLCPSGPIGSIPSGNVNAWFSDGPGVYTVRLDADDICGTFTGGSAAFVTTLLPPSCEIRAEPNIIFTGELSDVTVSWTTDHATSATLNSVNVPIGSGTKIFNGVSSSTTYSMLVNGPGGTSSCEARVTAYTPPTGGLVPCGRLVDDSATSWNEKNPCRLCHLAILSFNIINFLLTIVGIIAVLMLIVAGALHIVGGIDAETLSLAKKGINGVLFGFAIIFVAWVIINIAMVVFGFIDPIGDGSWKKFDCEI